MNDASRGNIAAINTRFEPADHIFHQTALPLVEAVGYPATLTIDNQLAQLLRLRVAQTNKCAFCTVLHADSARQREIEQTKIDNLPAYEQSALFSDAEKVALAYADALGRVETADFQRYHDAMLGYFTLDQLKDCAAVVINMHLWTRWKLAHGETPTTA